MPWQPLQEINFKDLTKEKYHELCASLVPFAVKDMNLLSDDEIKVWSNTEMLLQLGANEEVEVSYYTDDFKGTRDPVPLTMELPLPQAMEHITDLPEEVQAAYVKWGLPSALAGLPFASLFTERETTAADLPLLIAPGRSYSWLYVGTAGSGSKTHVDILDTSAWLFLLTGSKKWLLANGKDWSTLTDNGAKTPDMFTLHHNKDTIEDTILYEYVQEPGTAIFVPPKCLHAVMNTERSFSLTQNFVHPAAVSHWEAAIKDMMSIPNAPDATVSP
eukprot:TRINITY_DN1832_c0_g1_i1.p1 TRINITY_DN1832_c0_g1~~TRINITY_DN1832_c0_g1_i1.p1  ORF type:complete len:293 (+),score=61.34 TRINITY_DN1832_c0_g1_i1:59-880(+)